MPEFWRLCWTREAGKSSGKCRDIDKEKVKNEEKIKHTGKDESLKRDKRVKESNQRVPFL